MTKLNEHYYPKDVVCIPSALICAAQACIAPQKDERPLLKGVCITPEGWVQGCNGHAAFRGKTKTDGMFWVEQNQILHIHGKVPSSRDSCEIEWHDKASGVIRCVDSQGEQPDVLVAFETIHETERKGSGNDEIFEQKYPSLKAIVPTGPAVPAGRIGISGIQLTMPKKVFNTPGVIFEVRGTETPVCVYPQATYWEQFDCVLVLALMSLLPDDEDDSTKEDQLAATDATQGQ